MTAPGGWGQQQRQFMTVGLFLLDLLGTWFLVYLALDAPGSWCNWLLAYLVLSAPGFWRTWLLAFLVPGGDDNADWCSTLFAGGCMVRQGAGSGNEPGCGELIWRGRPRHAHTFWVILVDAR